MKLTRSSLAGAIMVGNRRDWLLAGLLAWMHLALAVIYKEFRFNVPPYWDTAMATLPADLLKSKPLESIWYLHAQPPLYNAYGAIMFNLWDSPFAVMHWVRILLGAAVCGMVYFIALDLLRGRWLAFMAALVFGTLNATLLVYEAGVFYTIHAAFLATAALFCVHLYHQNPRLRFLYALVIVTNLLVMTRTLYHLVFALAVCGLAAILAGSRWRRVLAISLLISTFSAGWYVKNAVQYGFFGESSWFGYNVWHIASARYSDLALAQKAKQEGLHTEVVTSHFLRRPAFYAHYGYNRTSEIAALNNDDFHNINYPDISPVYLADTLTLIRSNPVHYLGNVARAYIMYTRPSYELDHSQIYWTAYSAYQIEEHISLYEKLVYGEWFVTPINRLTGLHIRSLLIFLLPFSLVYYAIHALRCGRLSARRWLNLIRAEPVAFFGAALIAYTTLIACLFEYGENARFKAPVEPVMGVFIAMTVICMGQQLLEFRGRKIGS